VFLQAEAEKMDRYDEVTQRIEKSMRTDWWVRLVAPVALAVGLGALALGYARLGHAVTATTRCAPAPTASRLARAGCVLAAPPVDNI
jgi:hypothetical protein